MNGDHAQYALLARDLRYEYGRGLFRKPAPALAGVSLALNHGAFLGLIGPNGSGKSTFLRIFAGILRPSGGDAMVGGRPAGSAGALRSLGYVPENPRLPPNLTAFEALDMLAALSGLPRAGRREEIARWIETFGMKDRAGTLIRECSKGTAQKIGIIQALVHKPVLLLLDEPASGLDPESTGILASALKGLNSQGVTVVVSSHVLSSVEFLCGEVAVMHQGRLLKHGKMPEMTAIRGCFDARISAAEMSEGDLLAALGRAGFSAVHVRQAAKSLLEVFAESAGKGNGGGVAG